MLRSCWSVLSKVDIVVVNHLGVWAVRLIFHIAFWRVIGHIRPAVFRLGLAEVLLLDLDCDKFRFLFIIRFGVGGRESGGSGLLSNEKTVMSRPHSFFVDLNEVREDLILQRSVILVKIAIVARVV